MATRKIADLTQATTASDADLMVIQDTSKTKKITFATLLTSIKSKLGVGTAANLNTTSKEIVGAINEINTNLATTYNYDKMYNLWYTSGNVITDKVGKILIITIALQAKSPLPVNVWHKLIALPTGMRTAHAFYGNYDNGTYNTTIKVEENGDVLVLTNKIIAANEWLVGSAIISF